MHAIRQNWQDIAALVGVVAAGCGLLALVAFNEPTERAVPQDLAYRHTGEFSYTARAPEGTVYDSGAATPGEPVFRALSEGFIATFHYAFESEHAHAVGGTYRFVAEVSDDTGWRRTIELVPATAFNGDTFTVEAPVDLGEAQRLITILEEQTGITSRAYSLTLRPEVALAGVIDAEPLQTAFTPELRMEMDALQVRLPAAAAGARDPLRPAAEGFAPRQAGEANTLSLLALDLGVADARLVAMMGLGASVLAGGMLLLAATRPGTEGGPGPGGTRPGRKLTGAVTIRGGLPPAHGRMVDVASLDDLARLAETIGGPVLQEVRPGYHCFYLCDLDVTYRYQPARAGGAANRAEQAA